MWIIYKKDNKAYLPENHLHFKVFIPGWIEWAWFNITSYPNTTIVVHHRFIPLANSFTESKKIDNTTWLISGYWVGRENNISEKNNILHFKNWVWLHFDIDNINNFNWWWVYIDIIRDPDKIGFWWEYDSTWQTIWIWPVYKYKSKKKLLITG